MVECKHQKESHLGAVLLASSCVTPYLFLTRIPLVVSLLVILVLPSVLHIVFSPIRFLVVPWGSCFVKVLILVLKGCRD